MIPFSNKQARNQPKLAGFIQVLWHSSLCSPPHRKRLDMIRLNAPGYSIETTNWREIKNPNPGPESAWARSLRAAFPSFGFAD